MQGRNATVACYCHRRQAALTSQQPPFADANRH